MRLYMNLEIWRVFAGRSLLTLFCNLSREDDRRERDQEGRTRQESSQIYAVRRNSPLTQDADYGIYPPPKTQEQKVTSLSRRNARPLPLKWPSSRGSFRSFSPPSTKVPLSHLELRDYDQHDRPDPSLSNHQHPAQYHNHRPASSHPNDNAAQKAQGTTQGATKRPKEGDQRGVRNEARKGSTSAGKATVSSSLQMDQDYHGMLSEHVRSAYPNISNVSADMLRGLDIPRQLLQGQNGKSRGKE